MEVSKCITINLYVSVTYLWTMSVPAMVERGLSVAAVEGLVEGQWQCQLEENEDKGLGSHKDHIGLKQK